MQAVLIAILGLAVSSGARDDDKDTVVAAAKKAVELGSYSFKGTLKMELPSFGGRGGGNSEPQKFSGKHQARVGSTVLTESQEIVKWNGKTVTRPRAEWRVEQERGERGRGGRRWGRGRMFGGSGFALPHEDFSKFESKLEEAENTEKTETIGETDCTIYTIELTEDAAKGQFGNSRMLERMQDVELSAKGKIWIDAEGNILKYEIKASFVGSFGERDFEMSRTRTITLHGFDKTEVTIPKGVKTAVEKAEKESDEEDDEDF